MSGFQAREGFVHFVYANREDTYLLPGLLQQDLDGWLYCRLKQEGYEAVLISESIDVQIRGTAEQLDNLKEEHIRAVADLTDYDESTGNFMPVVKIVVDGIPDVGAVGENTVSIVIRKE